MNYRDEEDPFEEDIVFDQAGLLNTTRKSAKSAIRRVSSGKCATFSKTLGLCGAFLGLGLTCAIPGPVSPVPPTELREGISLMSPELTFKCAGFMIGSMFGGMLLDRFNRLFLVFLALLVTSVLVTIIPWCGVLWLLRTDMILLGATVGFLSTGGNVLCLDLWGRNSGPFMQALHFSFSLGVFLAPLLAQPLTGPIVVPSATTLTPSIPPTLHRLPRNVPTLVGFAEGGFVNATSSTAQPLMLSQAPSVLLSSVSPLLPTPNLTTLSPGTSSSVASVLPVSLQPAASVTVSSAQLLSNVTVASSEKTLSTIQKFANSSLQNSSTAMPDQTSSTTHRAPKPKPQLTNAALLDHSRDWDKVKVQKPPPEDLVPLSSTTASTTHASNVTTSVTLPIASSVITNANSSNATSSTTRTPLPSIPPPTSSALPLSINTAAPASKILSTAASMQAAQSASAPSSTVTTVHRPSSLAVLSQVKSGSDVDNRSTTVRILGHTDLVLKSQPQQPSDHVDEKLAQVQSHTAEENQKEQGEQTPVASPVQQSPQMESYDSQLQHQQIFSHQDEHSYSHQPQNHPVFGHKGEHEQHVAQAEKHEDTPLNVKDDSLKQPMHVSSQLGSSGNESSIGQVGSTSPLPKSGATAVPFIPKHVHRSKPEGSIDNDTDEIHTVIDVVANRLGKYGLSKMQLTYLVVGMVLLATSLLFLGFLCFNPRDPKSKTDEEETNGSVSRGISRGRSTAGRPLPRWLRNTLITLMLLVLMISSGVQAMYGQLIITFVTNSPLALSQSTGSALTATFWGALTSTRFACILLASAMSPTAMLIFSVALCSAATWLLSALATSSEAALWVGSVMVGIGTAPVFPSGLLWMQRHVLMTHKVAAMLVMGPAMGEMLFPSLAYKMMVSAGPASLLHIPALLSLCSIALWAATWRLARHPRRSLCSRGEGSSSGYQLANQNDEDDLLDLTMSPVINGNSVASRSAARFSTNGHGFHRAGS